MSEMPETELPEHGNNDPFRTRCAMLLSLIHI